VVRHGIGYVPEGRHGIGGLTVEKNLLLGAYVRRWKGETWTCSARSSTCSRCSARCATGSRVPCPAGSSRCGQQQMLAVGRALMSNPRLILLDEPSMGLSPKLIEDVLAVLQRLGAAGHALLLAEQNAKLTFEATKTCLVMENGEVAMTGTSAELRDDPRVRQVYLGL
jgi:branched-chain amino acid transport system ATP-binding protein